METLIWEILRGALHLLREEVTLNCTLRVVVDEMVMGQIVVVKKLHEDSIVVNERACAERISEALNWHGVIIDSNGSVDVKLFLLDSFNISSLFSKDSESKFTIINEHEGILLAGSILLDFLASDVAVLVSSDHLGKGILISLETVHHNPKFSVVFLDHSDSSSGVITDDAGNDWELGLNILRLCQVLEQLCVVVELKIWLQLLVTLHLEGILFILGALRLIVIVGNILTTCVSSLSRVTTLIDLKGTIAISIACFGSILLGT